MKPTTFVAHRDLLFSEKGKQSQSKLCVRVGVPILVDRTSTGVALDAGSAVCAIAFEGLGVADVEVHGVDTLHALAEAVNVDIYLRGMAKKFDFFWPTGEPYFDEPSS